MDGREPHRTASAGEFLDAFIHQPRVAYFSMEIALQADIPTYAGGLGVLAGDTLRSAADLEVPFVAVTLISKAGYFRQTIEGEGRQVEQEDPWEPHSVTRTLGAKVAVNLGGREVWVQGRLYIVEGHMGGRVPVVLLDTDLDENHPDDRTLTHWLYGGDADYRLRQECILGFGGVRLLHALGFAVRQYHMNEGHSALLVLELLRRFSYSPEELRPGERAYDLPRVRDLCNFTTHTPVEAGHDQFPYDRVGRIMDEFRDETMLKTMAGEERLNMTRLALNGSEYINGVAKRHAQTSRGMFPGYQVRAITNGVHPWTWVGEPLRKVYDAELQGWCHEPELLVNADRIADSVVWEAHCEQKSRLFAYVAEQSGIALNADALTIGFARRMTAYKRPALLFSDIERLRTMAARFPLQVVVAGKAHPRDYGGKEAITAIHRAAKQLGADVPVAFIPDYDMAIAGRMVAGVDVWLNTPQPPREASGTSGMKAAFNGVPNFSTLDGWWEEGWVEGITGWAIGEGGQSDHAAALYQKLEEERAPAVLLRQARLDSVDEGSHLAQRFGFQQSSDAPALCDRSLHALMEYPFCRPLRLSPVSRLPGRDGTVYPFDTARHPGYGM